MGNLYFIQALAKTTRDALQYAKIPFVLQNVDPKNVLANLTLFEVKLRLARADGTIFARL